MEQNASTLRHIVDLPFKKATFGMGCFWGCDCVFGVIKGVLRTRVGYSGGTTIDPTYKNIGDHTEVIEVDFDPTQVSYEELLSYFWKFHEYDLSIPCKAQYKSIILYHDDEQKKLAELSKKDQSTARGKEVCTEIQQAGVFYPAEDYHQKYRLQGHKDLGITLDYELLQKSHVAARLNGYLIGLGGLEQFESEISYLGLNEKQASYVREQLIQNEGGTLYC